MAPFSDAYCGTGSGCTESCSGTSINFCAGGVPTTVDCTSLGFSTCTFGRCLP